MVTMPTEVGEGSITWKVELFINFTLADGASPGPVEWKENMSVWLDGERASCTYLGL